MMVLRVVSVSDVNKLKGIRIIFGEKGGEDFFPKKGPKLDFTKKSGDRFVLGLPCGPTDP